MGMMAVDRRMRPLTGMATILDTRPAETLRRIEPEIIRSGLYRRTGCPPFAQYMLARAAWMNRKYPAIMRKSGFFLGVKEFLMWKICGELVTEPSTASATQMMGLNSMEWDHGALALAGINPGKLPPIGRGDRIAGRIPPETARQLGLPSGLPVVPGVYDGGAMALGLGALEKGAGVINLGTSAMYRVCVNRPVTDRHGMRLQTYALLPGIWLAGAGVNNVGIALEWFMSAFGVRGYREMERMASRAMSGPEIPMLFPYLTGDRDPRIGSRARGLLVGLRSDHDRGDLALAALEGTAFSLRLVQDALFDNGIRVRQVRAGGGGTRIKTWMGLIASILGRPMAVSGAGQPGLVGSAMLGFTATGEYSSLESASRRMAGKAFRVQVRVNKRLEDRYARYGKALAQASASGVFSA